MNEVLDSIDNKDSLIKFAEENGISNLTKQKNLGNLKKDVLLQLMSKESNSKSNIVGEEVYIVSKNNEEVARVTDIKLWCKENNFNYSIVGKLLNKSWLNHNGYSIKVGINE